MPVRIRFADSASREKAKAARGRWDPEKKVWFMRFGKINGTSLEKHIVLDAFQQKEYLKAYNAICHKSI